jgi:hypothetical protein
VPDHPHPPGDRRYGIDEFADAGFDHVYIHQVGRDQESFLRFARSELALVAP